MSIFNNIWVKRIPTYLIGIGFCVGGISFFLNETEAPFALKIIILICALFFGAGTLFIIGSEIKMAINHTQEAGCDNKGVWVMRSFIPWERIQEFRIARDDDFLKEIRIIVKDPMAEIQTIKNPFTRFTYKLLFKQKGTIYFIQPDCFNGSAEDFVAYLESEKKRYGKE